MTSQPIIGYSLSSEEHGGADLVRYGAAGVEHGFHNIIVSDHFHPPGTTPRATARSCGTCSGVWPQSPPTPGSAPA
jgi:hypothetical protein